MEFIDTPLGVWPDSDPSTIVRDGVAPCTLPRDSFLATSARAEQNLAALIEDDALCITTGQQPGLFLGPLYTVYKAIATIVASQRLETALGRQVVPIFWVAGDDHDFEESNHFNLQGGDGSVAEIRLRNRPAEAPSNPLYRELNGPEIGAVLDSCRELLPPTEFRDEILEMFAGAYAPEKSLAGSFGKLLAALLGDHGLVVLDATSAGVKSAQTDLLLAALEQAADLDRGLGELAAGLVAAGGRAPVKAGDGATLVMIEAEQGRDRLVIDDDSFRTRRSRQSFSLSELQSIAREEPQRLSANVLLRPVVEAAILPTVAYLGGPGELAYFGQCEPVYEKLGVVPQAKLPRWSAAVLEPKTKKLMERHSLSLLDLSRPEGQLETEIARDNLPESVTTSLTQLRAGIQESYESLRAAAVEIDPTLKGPVGSARNQALSGSRDVEKKILTHLKKKNETTLRQVSRARNDLFPGGIAQERVYSVLPFMVKHGSGFIDAAVKACRARYALGTTATPR